MPTTLAHTIQTHTTNAGHSFLANESHIARNCSKLPEMTRHLLIALQLRRVGAPHLVGMESNHLGYDSTAQSRQGAVVATRYPLFVQRKVSLPLTIQIKKEGERRFWLRKITYWSLIFHNTFYIIPFDVIPFGGIPESDPPDKVMKEA